MRMCAQLGAFMAASVLLACGSGGSPPPSDDLSRERIIATDEDGRVYRSTDASTSHEFFVRSGAPATFAVLSRVYADLGVPVSTVSSTRGQIGSLHFRVANHELGGKQLSLLVDCGSQLGTSARADVYEMSMSVMSTVTAEGESAAVITTMVAARGRPSGVSGDWVQCATTGYLEKAIDRRLAKGLAGP